MKKNYILIAIMLIALLPVTAQTAIDFDATNFSSPDDGGSGGAFMNVFDNPKNGTIGGFQFGSGWGIPDLVAILDTNANTVTLKPNRIGDPDAYWQTAGVLEGNKIMDANLFIQNDALVGTSFSFTGDVVSNTIDDSGLSIPYDATAFIKVFNADFSGVIGSDIADLSTSGEFALSMDATAFPADSHVQYGFQFIGPNLSSDASFDAAYDAVGSIVIQPATLSVDDFNTSQFSVFPNPAKNNWTINANSTIKSVQVYDILGKRVVSMSTSSNNVNIDATNLTTGMYIAQITSENGSKNIKLVKK
ncbi:T9SS type A sorting domain-containing protein [Psychroserpens sp. Hel_I_66]|uniref:T9SS type A sorting domain-containing protein n=1 Tax=Psychroserpens sp. Hel_I_66 TaxID=1250004 RepID=UPI0006454DD8|nr:T9SS type A sorting domain-containing protein [Psychroserpens sp. Hel_I_66]